MFGGMCRCLHWDVATLDRAEDVLGINALYPDECLVLNEYKYINININNYRYDLAGHSLYKQF